MSIINPVLFALRRVMPMVKVLPEWLRRDATNPIIYAARKAGHSLFDIKETVDSFMGKTRWLQYNRDISKMVNIANSETALFGWDRNRKFTQKVTVDTWLKGNNEYLATGNAILHDAATGETWYKPMSMYSEVKMTPEEYEDAFRMRFLETEEYKTISLVGIDFTSVQHNVRPR